MRNRLVALAIVAVAACACASSRPYVATQRANANSVRSERDEIFARALSVLQRRGWRIATSDKAAGLITSEWMSTGKKPCGVLVCESKSMLQISIAGHGPVTVDIRRELDGTKAYASGRDGSHNSQEYSNSWEAEELLADILGRDGGLS